MSLQRHSTYSGKHIYQLSNPTHAIPMFLSYSYPIHTYNTYKVTLAAIKVFSVRKRRPLTLRIHVSSVSVVFMLSVLLLNPYQNAHPAPSQDSRTRSLARCYGAVLF